MPFPPIFQVFRQEFYGVFLQKIKAIFMPTLCCLSMFYQSSIKIILINILRSLIRTVPVKCTPFEAETFIPENQMKLKDNTTAIPLSRVFIPHCAIYQVSSRHSQAIRVLFHRLGQGFCDLSSIARLSE